MTKKALMAWERVYQPESAGGLNILDIQAWNKAAIVKLLWNICSKKDKLWIHCYYGKNRDFFVDIPKQSSWIVQRILKSAKYAEAVGVSMNELSSPK